MMMSGIYKIQSKLKPKRIYIGSAVRIPARWWHHKFQLKNNKHANRKLQNHYNKYGLSDLEFSILTSCDKEELIEKEQFFIDAYKPYFNISITAGNPMMGRHWSEEAKLKLSQSLKGRKRSEETKQKMRLIQLNRPIEINRAISETQKGRHASDETKHRMSESQKGRVHSEETKEKLRIANIGKVITEETRIKIGKANKGHIASEECRKKMSLCHKGNTNMLGKNHSPEAKRKISEALKRIGHIPPSAKGIKRSEETKHKMSIAKTGQHHSEETKKKLSEYHKGRKTGRSWNRGKSTPEETKRKLSESGLKYWKLKKSA
jgi:group I intron endonuclease